MSKHKSEALTVKIQLDVKFLQAVITNKSTLPPVFRKMFWTAAWWKTRDGYFWYYVCKTIYLWVAKMLLQHLLKCALHLSSWRLKCYYSQRNSVRTERENIVPGNLCMIWKLNEAWQDSVTFLRLLKLLKPKMNSITALRLTEKRTPSLSYDSLSI